MNFLIPYVQIIIPKMPFIHTGNKYYHLPYQARNNMRNVEKKEQETQGELLPCKGLLASYKGLAGPGFLPLTNVISHTGVLSLLLSSPSCHPPLLARCFGVLSILSEHLFQQYKRKFSY